MGLGTLGVGGMELFTLSFEKSYGIDRWEIKSVVMRGDFIPLQEEYIYISSVLAFATSFS